MHIVKLFLFLHLLFYIGFDSFSMLASEEQEIVQYNPQSENNGTCVGNFINQQIVFIMHQRWCLLNRYMEYTKEEKLLYRENGVKYFYDMYDKDNSRYIRISRFIDFLYYYLHIIHFASYDNTTIYYSIHFTLSIVFQALFWFGIGGTKPFSSKYKFLGCEFYFGIGNIPYIGGIFMLALVCKPNFMLKYLPNYLKDRVTIHILDLKPLYYILDFLLNKYLGNFTYFGKDFKDAVKEYKAQKEILDRCWNRFHDAYEEKIKQLEKNVQCEDKNAIENKYRYRQSFAIYKLRQVEQVRKNRCLNNIKYPVIFMCPLYRMDFCSLKIQIFSFWQISINLAIFLPILPALIIEIYKHIVYGECKNNAQGDNIFNTYEQWFLDKCDITEFLKEEGNKVKKLVDEKLEKEFLYTEEIRNRVNKYVSLREHM